MKETYNFLQTYEICFKLIYLKLLQEYFNNEIIGFTDKTGEEESVYYTVTDIQGSITEVYDNDSNLVWKSGYTAFGELAGEVVDLIDFDGMYTGCDYDAETGLTYHWNRWRSEDGSCFISEDPARDGANWYGYAGQNPMVYVDRIGLFYYTGNVQQSSNNTNQAGTGSAETPSATPQNQSPNITGRGPSGMPEGVSPNLSQTNSNLYHYAGNNPVKYVDSTGLYDEKNGYTKQAINDFNNMCVKDQLAYLKNEVSSVELGTAAAGAKASFMRTQLKDKMKLKGLFYSLSGDEKFMNEDLRSFLNLNLDGKNEYSIVQMKDSGWFQMIPHMGDNEHQNNQNGGRNIKFCNSDGREAIFDAQNNYIGTGIDSSTYNYGYVSRLNPICITLGSTHGQYDMKPFFRQTGTTPAYWSMGVGSNYGFNSR